MNSHKQIDARSLALAEAIVSKVDADPSRAGLIAARENCARWLSSRYTPAIAEWMRILEHDWAVVRRTLLDPGEDATRLRQSNPFCGVISDAERASIFVRHFQLSSAA